MATSPPTHPNDNEALLTRLFIALGAHDHERMASCYDLEAEFRDIAFYRRGREQIHQMWRMICDGDIKIAEFKVVEVSDKAGRARLVVDYTVGRSKDAPDRRPVHNEIDSRFEFKDGMIFRQDDGCDAREWARQAVSRGPLGFLAGRIRPLRSLLANRKLRKFLKRSAE